MKLELKPHIDSVSQRVGPAATNAGASKDGSVRWVYENAYLEVSCLSTNEILGSWRFGKELQDKQTCITAVKDVKTLAGLLLVVATSNISDCGTLNIFSVKLRRIINVIEIPSRVSALEVIFENETDDVSPWIISKHLQFFSGLVAVGTEGGSVYLVDLCLDDLDMTAASEATPKKLFVITARIVNPLEKKEQARNYDKHLALLLDDQCHKQEHFYYRRQDDTVQKVFDKDTVWVSSLLYMAQAGTLAIGFNFGCFQLWRLYNPVLDYSSRYSPDNQAVTHFLSQEPENDPRNFVYLWVVYDNTSEDSISNICLYQLSFSKKDAYASFGTFYDELESVCPRLDHSLTTDPYSAQPSGTTRSTMISCYTLQNPQYTPPAILSDSFDDGFHGNDSSLSIFVWRADCKQGGRGSVTSRYWLSIFDINRWYHAQMPHTMRCHGASLQVCSFWAVYDLDDTVSQLSSQTLLNVEVNAKRVLKFINNSPVPPEEHSYPSALELPDIRFVMADGSIQAQCHGWQKSLLRELVVNGAEYLVQPADFYHQCLRARLLPQSFEESKTRSTDYQRKMLLNMALEQCLAPAFIPQCVKVWEEEGFAEHGCSLSLLLSWAWESVVATKTSFDKACSILYDWSGIHLDQRTNQQILQLSHALSHIRLIFNFFTVQAPPTTERGQFELELRQEVLTVLLQHCDVVRWAISFSLLPEVGDASGTSRGLFAFPADELQQAYERRRAELSSRKGVIDGTSLLLIDTLVESQGSYIQEVWQNLGGDGMYPPPSMQAMMNMYLIEEVSLEVKNAVMLYFLQNIAMLDPTPEREAAVASFIQRFMLSPSMVHQVQGFWFIDHSDYEEGVRHLVNANVHQDVCPGMSSAAVVNTLLAQGQGRLATCYMHSKPALGESAQEQELHISVLLDNRQVSQALDILRGCSEETLSVRLMEHLLRECQAHKLLGQLLQLNLTEWEESVLESYLRARPEAHALEPLLLYYLHRSRFLQAFRLNQDMNAQDKLVASLASHERSLTRNRLMEAYLKVLPEVTRKMLIEKQTTHAVATSAQRIQVDHPKPLSTVVRHADFQGMSQAKFIMAVIDKVNEARHLLDDEEEEEERKMENSILKDGPDRAFEFDIPFLKTPRTPSHTPAKRKSGVFHLRPDSSPLATPSRSQSAKKTLAMIRDAETQEEKDSLKKLAEECLKVLQTPVRDHKRRSMSPHPSSQISNLKTPQSILKVRRLSKTLANSREKLSTRRTSGSRPVRLGVSKSDTSHNTSVELKSPITMLTTATPTQKQLRFTGISPSPTPSPSVNLSVSINTENVSINTEKSIESEQGVISPQREVEESLPESVSKVTEITDVQQEIVPTNDKEQEQEMEVVVTDQNITPPKQEKNKTTLEILQEDTQVNEWEQLSFEEGPDDRYSDQLKVLVRPDLQSPWKQGSPGLVEVDLDSHKSPGETSPSLSSPKSTVVEERHSSSFVQQSIGGQQVSATHTAEKHSVSYTEEVISRTSLRGEHMFGGSAISAGKESGYQTSESFHFEKPLFPAPKSSSVSPKASSPKLSDTSGLAPIRVEISPPANTEKPPDSPPATPPSSKRAKMMTSKEDDTTGLIEIKPRSLRASPGEEREMRRRKTPERKTTSLKQTSEEPVPDRIETRRVKTPERKSPSRQQKSSEESARKTPERRSPSRKVKKLSEDAVASEELSEERDPSPRRSRRTPERKSPARRLDKSSLQKISVEMEEVTHKATTSEESVHTVENFEDAETMLGTLQEPQLETGVPEVPERRRSTRLNTPDRHLVDLAGSKISRKRKQSETTSLRQEEGTESSAKEEKFASAEEVLGDKMEPELEEEAPTRRRSTRLNTPDRSIAEPARARLATPTRSGRQRRETPPRQQKQKSTSEEEEKAASEQSLRIKSNAPEISAVKEVTDSAPSKLKQSKDQTKASEISDTEEEVQEPHNLRKSGRHSKTPDRFLNFDTESRKILRRDSKTPDRQADQDKANLTSAGKSKSSTKSVAEEIKSTSTRRTRRDTKTSDTIMEEEPEPEQSLTEQSDSHNLRSRRQSKTPERQGRKSVEPLTPTRRSRRQHKTPEVLNTDEIEPVPVSSSLSPKRKVKEMNTEEPATPPKMSLRKPNPTEESGLAAKKVLGTLEEESEEILANPTRRSVRKTKSPDRLNTDQIQPVSPHGSPTRSKLQEASSESTTTAEKSEKLATTVEKVAEESLMREFVFSPPVTHKGRGQGSDSTNLAESEQDISSRQHHFVFSSPSVASPPKEEEQEKQPVKQKTQRPRKQHKLYSEGEVMLLSPVTSPVGTRNVTARKISETQRAAAVFLNRSKKVATQKRRLVPSRKKSAKET